MSSPAIALNRFGLGARPTDSVPTDAQRWLLSQLDAYDPLPEEWRQTTRTAALVDTWNTMQRDVRQAPDNQRSSIREAYLRQGRLEYQAAVGARTNTALQTDTPFMERLVHFWSNHFAVSIDKQLTIGLAGSFEADAIRPNVLGNFEDLLLAVVKHPAMLLFLDQAQSIGPQSTRAEMAQRGNNGSAGAGVRGLNENLAREILELHTMGVRSGYTQADVTEFARALTGWTLPGDRESGSGATFRFVPQLHEPGSRNILGRTYAEGGERQARAVIHDLVTAPATALHIAKKLVRHFVADDPPADLVQRLADTFTNRWRFVCCVPHHHQFATNVDRVFDQIQIAVGLVHFQPARFGQPHIKTNTGNKCHGAIGTTRVATRLACWLRRFIQHLGCARRSHAAG